MIFLRIFAIFFFLAEVVFVIKSAVEYNRRYKAFVDFLRKESDGETLKAINSGGKQLFNSILFYFILFFLLQKNKRLR